MTRVLVTASRTWPHSSAIGADLTAQAIEHGYRGLIVVHGDAGGGDQVAQRWARRHEHLGVINESHPAQWRIGGSFNPRAGTDRNTHMVNLGAAVCLAYARACYDARCLGLHSHYTHGTTDCGKKAEEAGIPVKWRRSP